MSNPTEPLDLGNLAETPDVRKHTESETHPLRVGTIVWGAVVAGPGHPDHPHPAGGAFPGRRADGNLAPFRGRGGHGGRRGRQPFAQEDAVASVSTDAAASCRDHMNV